MTEILLEETFDEKGKYLGKIVVYTEVLTPEFIDALKADLTDKQGWKKYRNVMKKAGYDIG